MDNEEDISELTDRYYAIGELIRDRMSVTMEGKRSETGVDTLDIHVDGRWVAYVRNPWNLPEMTILGLLMTGIPNGRNSGFLSLGELDMIPYIASPEIGELTNLIYGSRTVEEVELLMSVAGM